MLLILHLLLLGALALFTAYTRNFQRTIVEFGGRLDQPAAARLMPRGQRFRTATLLAGWPIAIGLGTSCVAWKAMALVLGTFLILVTLLEVLTPPGSRHYVARLRDDLQRRVGEGDREVEELRQILERLDEIAPHSPS